MVLGYRLIQDNIFLGVGVEKYSSTITESYDFFGNDYDSASHNIFIKLLAESGILTFCAFILMIALLTFMRTLTTFKSKILFWLAFIVVIMIGQSLGILIKSFLP